MSLDVYLTEDASSYGPAADFLEENGFPEAARRLRQLTENPACFYDANITHNLGRMAEAAGIYEACWRPEEIGVTKARQLISPLRAGLEKLRAGPSHFRQFDASNGWGTYPQFVSWVEKYLAACEEYPDAAVSVSR